LKTSLWRRIVEEMERMKKPPSLRLLAASFFLVLAALATAKAPDRQQRVLVQTQEPVAAQISATTTPNTTLSSDPTATHQNPQVTEPPNLAVHDPVIARTEQVITVAHDESNLSTSPPALTRPSAWSWNNPTPATLTGQSPPTELDQGPPTTTSPFTPNVRQMPYSMAQHTAIQRSSHLMSTHST